MFPSYPKYPILQPSAPQITNGVLGLCRGSDKRSSRCSPGALQLLSRRLADRLLAMGLESVIAAEVLDDVLAVLLGLLARVYDGSVSCRVVLNKEVIYAQGTDLDSRDSPCGRGSARRSAPCPR